MSSESSLTAPTFIALAMLVSDVALRRHAQNCEGCRTINPCATGLRLSIEAGRQPLQLQVGDE